MKRTIRYGSAPSQVADLYLPDAARRPVICLLHGGFWRLPYGREQFDAVARDLVARKFVVWNLEYRRLGELTCGWPETLGDVAAGIDHLATLAADEVSLDITRVIVAGHSAGGQLALWASARHNGRRSPGGPIRIRPRAVAGLAAILDLRALFAAGGGNHAVRELLGGSPAEQPARYAAASPAALLPLGVPQLIIHGTEDDTLPVEVARDYARAATSAGDSIQFRELAHVGHMDYLDPSGDAHDALCDWLEVASS